MATNSKSNAVITKLEAVIADNAITITLPCDLSQFVESSTGKSLLNPFGTGGWAVIGVIDGKPIKLQCNMSVVN